MRGVVPSSYSAGDPGSTPGDRPLPLPSWPGRVRTAQEAIFRATCSPTPPRPKKPPYGPLKRSHPTPSLQRLWHVGVLPQAAAAPPRRALGLSGVCCAVRADPPGCDAGWRWPACRPGLTRRGAKPPGGCRAGGPQARAERPKGAEEPAGGVAPQEAAASLWIRRPMHRRRRVRDRLKTG